MTQQYQQEAINDFGNPSSLEIQSFDFRQTEALVPPGTTASYQRVRIPGILALSRLSWSGVVAPGVGETIELRLFRVRPSSNPAGFGFVQLNNTFTISAATFTDPGGDMDISDTIIPGRCVLPGEYLACSWVHAGVAVMQPLDMNWNLRPVGAAEEEPSPTFTLAQYAQVFG